MNTQSLINKIFDFEIKITYISIAFDDDEIIINLNIKSDFSVFVREKESPKSITNIVFIGPVLHSSDGEVRTFGFIDEFDYGHEIWLEYEMRKSTIGQKIFNKFANYEWNIYRYEEHTNNFNPDAASIDHIRNIRREPITHDIGIKMRYNIIIKIIIYYAYTKYMYGNDYSNIEDRDANFIKFIESKMNLTAEEYKELLYLFENNFYLPYNLIYTTKKTIIKITPIKHDTEWTINKFLYLLMNYRERELVITSTLPGYQYFRYRFNIGEFIVNNKLLIRLKFNDTKVVKTNVYMGNHMGISIYQNLLNIKNQADERIVKFKDIDYHNLIIMNILNLRFLHLCGISHNDLHLNNILFKEELEFIPYQREIANVHNMRVAYKHFLHLGSIDFTIIDMGRACYINDQDILLKRIRKINKDFYMKHVNNINHMFDEDLKMTGYVLTMFDYIEYIQSIIIGYKWIGDTNLDYDKLHNIINDCYEIVEAYLIGNNKKLTSRLVNDILSAEHYRRMPEMMFEFSKDDCEMELVDFWPQVVPEDNKHPIDIIIEKYFPDNIASSEKIPDLTGYAFELFIQE